MSKPKVSIIIPAYNVEKYFENCLLSMINQTLKEIEIVIVVDGATDNTGKMAKKYQLIDNRIKVFITKNNGSAVAKNIGLENSSGEYVAFIDADDQLEIESLEELYDCAKDNDVDVVCFGYKRIFANGLEKDETLLKKVLKNTEQPFKCKDILGNFLSVYGQGVSNKLVKKSLLIDNCINFEADKQTQAEDLYVSYQILFTNPKVFILNKPFYRYVQRSDSCLNSKSVYIGNRYLQLFERINDKIPQNNMKSEYKKILGWLAFYMTTFMHTNWKLEDYIWFKGEMANHRRNVLYNELMKECFSLQRINNEKVNAYILRKVYSFLYMCKAFDIAELLLYLRLCWMPNLKRRFKQK